MPWGKEARRKAFESRMRNLLMHGGNVKDIQAKIKQFSLKEGIQVADVGIKPDAIAREAKKAVAEHKSSKMPKEQVAGQAAKGVVSKMRNKLSSILQRKNTPSPKSEISRKAGVTAKAAAAAMEDHISELYDVIDEVLDDKNEPGGLKPARAAIVNYKNALRSFGTTGMDLATISSLGKKAAQSVRAAKFNFSNETDAEDMAQDIERSLRLLRKDASGG